MSRPKRPRCILCTFVVVEPSPYLHKIKRGHFPMVLIRGTKTTITDVVELNAAIYPKKQR